MARTQLNGDMNGQFLKSFCIFLRKSRLVRSIQRKPWVCPPTQLRIIKRLEECISVFVTNNYLAGVGHPPRLGKHPPSKDLWSLVFGGHFQIFIPNLINGQERRCSVNC